MKHFWIIFFLPLIAFSQSKMDHRVALHPYETELSRVTFHDYFVRNHSSESEILDFIFKNNTVLSSSELVLEYMKPSKAGYHYSFLQKFNGREIYLSQVKVNTDLNNRITTVIEKIFDTRNIDPFLPFPVESKVNQYLSTWPGVKDYESREVYGYNGIQLLPARAIALNDMEDQYFEVVIDYFGNEMYRRDMKMYVMSDTTLFGKMFNPDPLTSAGVVYGAPYVDNNDSDVVVLNAQRFNGSAQGKFELGLFYLENEFVKLAEFSNPVTAITTSSNGVFDFLRSENGFEDYNAFYHLNRFKNFLTSQGYTNLVDYQIEVDAHALNGADNSAFQGNMNSGRLLFGEGGVDDAEDADVIIHEYGHAISTSASNSNIGVERRTVDEAIGDYFAAMYSRHINSFGYERVFSWDGHNEFWNGRSCVSNKCYTNIVFGSSVHQHADLFSSFLVSVTNQLGLEVASEILLESMYSYAINISMRDAALLFLQADTLLNSGSNSNIICQVLQQYCFSPCTIGISEESTLNVEVIGTYEFSRGGELIVISPDLSSIRIEIFDQMGRRISCPVHLSSRGLHVSGTQLSTGMYFMVVSSNQITQSFKLARY